MRATARLKRVSCYAQASPAKAAAGFTLVELILAGMLTALVVVSAVTAMAVAAKSHTARRNASTVCDIGATAIDIIRRDLLNVFLAPVENRTRFVGLDMEDVNGPSDQLILMSAGYNTTESLGGESDMMEVHYYIDNDSTTEERWLQRRTDATPDDDPFTGGMNSLLGPHVISLDFQYYDGIDWWPSWDSKEELPVAVAVSLAVLVPDPREREPMPQTFETIVWLPVYRSGEGTKAGQSSSQSTTGGTQGGAGGQGGGGSGGSGGGGSGGGGGGGGR